MSHHTFAGFKLTVGGRSRVLEHVHTAGVSVDRAKFDYHLWKQASSLASVTALSGAKVASINRSMDESGKLLFSVKVGSEFFYSKQLIVADGSNSAVAKMLGISTVRYGPARTGATTHFVGTFKVQPRYVNIFIERDFEVYVTPLSRSRLNIAVLTRFDSKVDIGGVLQDPHLQHRIFSSIGFKGDIESPPVGRSPIGNARRSGVGAEVFLVGDAAEEFDPIGGMGMTHALVCAELAASQILSDRIRNTSALTASIVEYERKRHAAARAFRVFTRVSYGALRSAHFFPPMLDIVTSKIGHAVSSMLAPH